MLAGVQGDPIRILVDEMLVGHALSGASQIQQLPFLVEPNGLVDHRQHRGDTDAAGNETIVLRGSQTKVVARPAKTYGGTEAEFIMNFDRAAGPMLFALYSNPVLVRTPTITTQGVLADFSTRQHHINVRAGCPIWQSAAIAAF